MSKRRLSNREQLRKMIREAESSLLKTELTLVLATVEQHNEQTVPRLITLLKSITQQAPKHFVAQALGAANDERAIRPLMQAAQAVENKDYQSNFL